MSVRREQVILDLTDNLTPGLARAAVAAKLLDRELDSLGRTSVRSGRDIDRPAASVGTLGTNSRKSGSEIDRLSGRLRLLTDTALILGPALVPLGAAAVGGLVALTAQLGAAAGGLGVALLAVQGLGDGLKALDAYQLEPTAANLAKLNQEMEKLGPAGEDFVRFLDSIEPNLKTLQNAAREGLLPGAQEGIESLLQRLPELRKMIRGMASTMGDQLSDAGAALGGKRFDAFFEYLRTDGVQILDDTGRTIGALTETVANLFAAFGGTSANFSGGLLEFSRGLAEASSHLESSAGFQEFLDYIGTEGPHAIETLGSLGNALLQIVEATAPLGGPVLTIVGTFADAVAMIADSDIGTPIFVGAAALALLNRSMVITASLSKATWGGPAVASIKAYGDRLGTLITAQDRATMSAKELAAAEKTRNTAQASLLRNTGRAAALGGILALSMSGVAESTGLSNAAMLSMVGPWGTAAGLILDVWHATDGLEAAMAGMDTARASGDMEAFAASIAHAKDELQKVSDNTILGTSMFGDTIGGISNAIAPLSNLGKTMAGVTGLGNDMAAEIAKNEAHLADMAAAEARIADGATAAVGPLRFLRVATQENAEAAQASAEAAQAEADALLAAVDAMRAKRNEALRSVDAELNYQQAIDDARKALKENGKTVDATTEKGRNNLRSLYALADGWNQQSNAAKNAKGSLQAARQGFIDTATDMGMAAERAKRLADRLFEIPPKRKTEIEAETAAAEARLKAIQARLAAIKSKSVTVTVNQRGGVTSDAGGRSVPVPGESADGGTVPKSGRPYADRYHYLLADGEEVISNRWGQADRHRALLKKINAGRLADGGTAGGGGRQTFFIAGIEDLGVGIKGLIKALNKANELQQKAVDRAKAARDDALSRRDSISSSIQGGLAGDIWTPAEGSTNVWAAGASPGGTMDPTGALRAQTDRARRLVAAINTLKAKGVTGPALLEIIGTGNVERAEMMAALPIAELAGFSAAQGEASAALAAAGLAGGNAIEGDNLRATNRELREQLKELREIKAAIKAADEKNQQGHKKNAEDVTAGVNGAASNGHRRRK